MTPNYRFLLRPKWLVLHVLALAALALMIVACFWQLSRLHEKQARNRLYDARAAQPVEEVAAVVPVGADPATIEASRYRLLSAHGHYLPDEEVFVRSRSLDGHPGAWVLTPLALDDRPGEAVIVNRGWIPASDTTPALPAGAEAPEGPVVVSGLALAGEKRGALGTVDAEGTTLRVLARADLVRLQEQLTERLLPVYLQLQAQEPTPAGQFPAFVPPPEHDEGPHRGYAGQWAIFAVIWVVGYPLLLRRSAIRRAQDAFDEQHDATPNDAESAQDEPPGPASVLSLDSER